MEAKISPESCTTGKTEANSELLERSLSRLAFVVEGIDVDHDVQLSAVRQELRNQKNVRNLTNILEKIQLCINKMDENPQGADAAKLLRQLLLALNIFENHQSQLDNLAIKLKDVSNQQARQLLPEIVSLLDPLINDGLVNRKTESRKTGLLQKLGWQKLNSEVTRVLHELVDKLQLPDMFKTQRQQLLL